MDLVLGIVAAVAASSLYSLGIALQAMDAREAPQEEHLRLALAWGLVRRSRWLLGTGLSIMGWPLQVVALLLAPLVVVQPALAAGLVLLMLLGERMLGERAGRAEYVAVTLIVLGVVGAALTAPPRSTAHGSEDLKITVVLVALGAASLLPYLLNAFNRSFAEATMLGAGLAFGWSAVATKLASDDLAGGHLVVAGAWALSTAAASGVGALSEMSALQSRPAIQVAPVVFVTQTAVPLVLAPLLLGEHFGGTPLGGVPLAMSLALLVLGAALLARSPLLLELMTAEQRSRELSGSTPSRSEASQDTIRTSPSSDAEEEPSSTTTTSPARIRR
jgi:hypothetical protein